MIILSTGINWLAVTVAVVAYCLFIGTWHQLFAFRKKWEKPSASPPSGLICSCHLFNHPTAPSIAHSSTQKKVLSITTTKPMPF